MSTTETNVELLVCVTCRNALDMGAETDQRPGAVLCDALAEAPLDGVTVRAVECLSNCSRGCTIALRGPGRWTYVYGNLHETQQLDSIRDGAAKYRDTLDGLVPWRERPEHFRKNCIARIPPLETPHV